MKHNPNIDGQFQIDGQIVQYTISDNYSQKPKVICGVETISRNILFFDNNGTSLGMNVMYGDYDEMQNISPATVKEYYMEMLSRKK